MQKQSLDIENEIRISDFVNDKCPRHEKQNKSLTGIKESKVSERKSTYDRNYNLSTEATNVTNAQISTNENISPSLSPIKMLSIGKTTFTDELSSSMSKQKKSLDFLTNFLDRYQKSDDFLKENGKIFNKKVNILKNSYKMSLHDTLAFEKKDLSDNLMPFREKKPLFYVENNECKFYDRSDKHVLKTINAINKCDDYSAFKFRNVINDKFGFNNNSLGNYGVIKVGEKFNQNHDKVQKILNDTNSKKKIVLFKINQRDNKL